MGCTVIYFVRVWPLPFYQKHSVTSYDMTVDLPSEGLLFKAL